jgi:xylan 1,4-beta-xylosidase
MAIEFKANLASTPIPLKHSWEHTVGNGRALLALRADSQAQLMRVHGELGFLHLRSHGVLDDEMGTLISHAGKPLYSFFNTDQINDYLLSIGMRPFVELSFMPSMLASGSSTVFQYCANITPPRDYRQWGKLIDRLVRHWIDQYGLDEIREWYFEVWNEPNLSAFWSGGKNAYQDLYRTTVETIKNVDSRLKVGGPASAQSDWIIELLDYCDKRKLPIDFISTHYYPTDAFGKIGAGTFNRFQHAPHDVMKEKAKMANAQARGLPLYYTEWNVSSDPRDPLRDEPFAAAFAVNIALSVDPFVTGYSFWTFTDIFDEDYFPSMPFHGGFGLLNLHGIPKPVYRAFQLLHDLGDKLYKVKGSHDTANVWVSRGDEIITVLITNYAMPKHGISTVSVHVQLTGAPRPLSAHVIRIDENNVNPQRVWRDMGEPEYLSLRDVEELQAASALNPEPYLLHAAESRIEFDIAMPPQSVAAMRIECVADGDTTGYKAS